MSGADSGWDIATAIGTCGAVIVGITAICIERYTRVRDTHDGEAAQARLVTSGVAIERITGNVLSVVLTNHSQSPIFGLELDSVVWTTPGQEFGEWRVPPTVGGLTSVNLLAPGASHVVPVEFLDANGSRLPLRVPGSYRATFSFHDARGLTWSRTAATTPKRVRQRRRWLIVR